MHLYVFMCEFVDLSMDVRMQKALLFPRQRHHARAWRVGKAQRGGGKGLGQGRKGTDERGEGRRGKGRGEERQRGEGRAGGEGGGGEASHDSPATGRRLDGWLGEAHSRGGGGRGKGASD